MHSRDAPHQHMLRTSLALWAPACNDARSTGPMTSATSPARQKEPDQINELGTI